MTDEEFVFLLTERERKRNGWGDKNKVRQGGRIVRMPSDSLTKKEREALNGECVTYRTGVPVKMDELKTWPTDVQREYLEKCYWECHGTVKDIGAMLGISAGTVCNLFTRLQIEMRGPYRRTKKEYVAWDKFVTGATKIKDLCPEKTKAALEDAARASGSMVKEVVKEPMEKHPVTIMPTEESPDKEPVKTEPEGNRILALAAILERLAGTGAKVTIEVTL